ncbi:hypothetical protein K7432_008638 [Basidiobolus ranarum]|uniref:UBA domain-containing protein n=1 Tax=Basidiobolus ranarum TaxID=34480 RepID=A0ABR2WRM7_9FUNG
MEVAQATWGSAIEETKTKQREEFINFVKILYNKHQEKLAEYEQHQLTNSLEEGNIDKSIFDSAFLEFSEKHSNPTPELASLMPNVTAQTAESPSSPKIKPPEDPALSKMIAELQEMGFNREQAECALEITNRDAEQAVMLLLENPHAIEVKIHEKRQIQSRKLESNVNRTQGADSPLARKKISGRVNSSDSLSKQAKSWSPMSFLNQRQAQLSSNSNPSVRKLGGWLGRAMENLKMDENETERRQKKEAELVENMTITLGTHVKSKYNVRLQVTDLDALMQTGIEADHITEIHAQTTSSLYSESLSASVLLLELKDWPKYISGKSANQPFFKKCRQTTEFHFDDVETQMKTIQQDFEEPNSPQPGDFFITRHSNLPMIHLVFHLFIGPDRIFFMKFLTTFF